MPRAFHPAPGDSIETAENQPRTKLSETHSDLLEQLYIRAALSVEDLPYSDEMESLYRDFVRESGRSMTIRDVYEALKDLERQGRLSPPFPSSSGSPKR